MPHTAIQTTAMQGPLPSISAEPVGPQPGAAARLSTLALLEARKHSRSKPGRRNDGRFLALVVEGGGMRGVISSGMLSALEELGLRDCFDAVYGSSAGAIGGAYFIAGQARYGLSIYGHINNGKFINVWRVVRGRPVVSLEFLLDGICATKRPLAFDRVLKSDIPLRVLAASIARKGPVILDNFQNRQELLETLRGSCRIPFFAGPPVHFRGDRFLDASLYVSIPFQAALDDGATDILILLSRPAGYLRRPPSWINRRLVLPFLMRIDPALAPVYAARAEKYRSEIEMIRSHAMGKALPEMVLIHPPMDVAGVWAFETSRDKLDAGAEAGSRAVHVALGSR